MPRYRANAPILLAHESRVVPADEEFTTVFPKVMVNGELVDMKLGSNITLLEDPEAKAKPAKEAKAKPEAPAPADPEAKPADQA